MCIEYILIYIRNLFYLVNLLRNRESKKIDLGNMYDTTEEYQSYLLTFFECKEEDLVFKIDLYYHSIESDELTKLCKLIHERTNIPLEMAFYVLFSYDYFKDVQRYLKDHTYYSALYEKIKL